MHSSSKTYVLPDLAAICKWKATFNPHHDEVANPSSQWVLSFGVFQGTKIVFFREGGSELLCSYVYPYVDAEKLRTACDFVNLLFVVDEVSDDQNGKDARHTGEVFLNAMRYPDWDDGSALAKMTRESVAHVCHP